MQDKQKRRQRSVVFGFRRAARHPFRSIESRSGVGGKSGVGGDEHHELPSAEEHPLCGLAEEVNEAILHSAFVPFGDIKDVKTPLDQATQKHRSFGFVTFLEREDAAAAMDNMDGAELYGRVLTVNYAFPERIKGGEQGWAAQPIWADADTWFERQQQEEEMQRLQAEHQAAMQAAEELHRKKLAEEREGEKEEETEKMADPMAAAEAEVLKQSS
ncbi:hypothetical protein MUK42_29337 [Musa troglodytarum]|uniref:RRM domain-containing protein n=1 Tax=Musa troglodytarum TaxID=320322 RepID=A0A9E7FPS4_9LILI|nr:hypothetical protein MUK42_29337 [Musa troglodytarum]